MALLKYDFIDVLLTGPGLHQVMLRRNGRHVSEMVQVPSNDIDAVHDAVSLYKACEKLRESCGKDIFRIKHNDVTFRVAAESRAVSGNRTFTLRRCAVDVPTLESIAWPEALVEKLLHPTLRGLVLVTGPMGVGKTYSVGGVMAGRLERLGGYARTLEDPAELPLDGLYGDDNLGICVQSEVEQTESGYADALKKVVREAPDMILVGEVRDRLGAAELLRAGLLGHLVFSTMHADNVTGALERLRSFARSTFGEETSQIMAEAITAIIHIKDGSRRLEILFLNDEGGRVMSARSIVAAGDFTQLRSAINAQAHGIGRGGDDAVFGRSNW